VTGDMVPSGAAGVVACPLFVATPRVADLKQRAEEEERKRGVERELESE
jgi:hypothetical protein